MRGYNQQFLAFFDGVCECKRKLRAWCTFDIFSLLSFRRFHKGQIFFAKFKLNRLQVSDRVDSVVDVDNLLRLKCTHNVENTVHRLYVGQKGVAKPGTLSCTSDLQTITCRVLQTSPNDAQCTGQKQARANSRVLRYQQRATMPGIVMVAATSRTASRTCAGMSLPLAHCDSLGACRRRFLPFIWNCNL